MARVIPYSRILLAALLVLGLALAPACTDQGGGAKGGCTLGGQLEQEGLIIVPLSAFTKKRITGEEWAPLELLDRPCQKQAVPPRVEIDERTEFYAFYSPREQKEGGLQVVFTWYFGRPQRIYSRPQVKVLVKRSGFARPVALTWIWSKPHGSSKVLSMGGLHSVTSKAQWEASRIYGPRTLVISRLAGFDNGRPQAGETLARVSFEIHEKGVQIY
ncbi:MAG: hypothetical protein K9K66_03250 [Desulfarculaceae bacterium]|nr:hypothetical protein [Desulfarculaceae bacterium]MCF8071064.1 hypothetical protein [Desulfarculaceae bacterium]MCF8100652.1 hypothetical protein [Desulfarculaceae bacterium]MCF8116914.1 hypothetical protein [Desulfarculaceae bacterium]